MFKGSVAVGNRDNLLYVYLDVISDCFKTSSFFYCIYLLVENFHNLFTL